MKEVKKIILDYGWSPKHGLTASLPDATGKFRDVYIRRVATRAAKAVVCELPDIDHRGRNFTVDIPSLSPPIVPDINTRFEYMEKLIGLAVLGKLKALFIFGEGGIGKSFSVQNTLDKEELVEGEDYVLIKGHASPRATYNLIKEFHDRVLIFDDCDSVLTNHATDSIMKAVLDAWAKRRQVSWLTTGVHKESTRWFEFTGSVIFVSNMSRAKVDEAILSRCVVMDMEMTVEEKIARLAGLLANVASPLRYTDRLKVFEVIKQHRYNITGLNVRTLLKAMDIFYQTKGDLSLVRYQILQ